LLWRCGVLARHVDGPPKTQKPVPNQLIGLLLAQYGRLLPAPQFIWVFCCPNEVCFTTRLVVSREGDRDSLCHCGSGPPCLAVALHYCLGGLWLVCALHNAEFWWFSCEVQLPSKGAGDGNMPDDSPWAMADMGGDGCFKVATCPQFSFFGSVKDGPTRHLRARTS
jgi:hypothetical protein